MAHEKRAQGAMEYLMTYGWAVLIVAIVLAGLYALGVFTPSGPRAQPGQCSVARPVGSIASLAGQCTSELPEFVAYFPAYSGTTISSSGGGYPPVLGYNYTITAWVELPSAANAGASFGGGPDMPVLSVTPGAGGLYLHCDGGLVLQACTTASTQTIPTDQWVFVAAVVRKPPGGSDNSTITFFVNSNQDIEHGPGLVINPSNMGIGSCRQHFGYVYCAVNETAYLADVQVYNQSLTTADVDQIYMEGIGGPPTALNYLVAWWPLNSNLNDYSGNHFNMVPFTNSTPIKYTSSWSSGYQGS